MTRDEIKEALDLAANTNREATVRMRSGVGHGGHICAPVFDMPTIWRVVELDWDGFSRIYLADLDNIALVALAPQ